MQVHVPLNFVADLSWLLLLMTLEPCLVYLSQSQRMCSPAFSQILVTSHLAAAQIVAHCHDHVALYFAAALAQNIALAHFVHVSVCCDAAASLSSQISVYFVLSYFGGVFSAQIFVHIVSSRSGAGILVSSHIVELVDVLPFPDQDNLLLCYVSV